MKVFMFVLSAFSFSSTYHIRNNITANAAVRRYACTCLDEIGNEFGREYVSLSPSCFQHSAK